MMTNQEICDRVINPPLINHTLKKGKKMASEPLAIQKILLKAAEAQGLTLEESAALLNLSHPDDIALLYKTAQNVKEKIYGNRIVLFAPLYVSNFCVNGCTYCGYQHQNKSMKRIKLTLDQIKIETQALLTLGHKRLVLESGEDNINLPINYIIDAIKAIYSVEYKGLNMRRININIAATTVEEYRLLHEASIGTYILFQESYHADSYKKMHPTGPKSNFTYHTSAMHRAMEGGIDDVGFGALFGLYDYRYEALSMLHHAHILEEDYGIGPHTISVPRLKKAEGMELSDYPYALSDDDFYKLVAILRLSLPYAGLILSTRESIEMRNKALKLGVSQISAGSCTGVGGYMVYKDEKTEQFSVSDERSPIEVARSLCEGGFVPSFCTACYRQGRTGDRFMELAKSGEIQKVCAPNALITLKEFALDFDPNLATDDFIKEQLSLIEDDALRQTTKKYLHKLNEGKRDLFI